MTQGHLVDRVERLSIADEIGIRAGDRVLAIHEDKIGDILEWRLSECCERLLLSVRHLDGRLVEYDIEKDYDEPLGIIFASPTLDEIHSCQNNCLFCFIEQLPLHMRETLYIKDDDYRLSFLTGSYITLTNLSEEDLQRIIRLRLSPLYISVHATDAHLRRFILRNQRAGEIMPLLRRLAAAGIQYHTQVVLCPGLNDGKHLQRTIGDLYRLYPATRSLAVVAVGLTGHRRNLFPLSPFNGNFAREVLDQVERWQARSLSEHQTRFVFACDEFYTYAGQNIPPHEYYEDYPQLENGVGLVRLLYNEWEAWRPKIPSSLPGKVRATIATGESAAIYLADIVNSLNNIAGMTVRLIAVPNHFFGGHVTVAGLLTFHDLNRALAHEEPHGPLYLSQVMFKEGTNIFLDGRTSDDLADKLGMEVRLVSGLDQLLKELTGQMG